MQTVFKLINEQVRQNAINYINSLPLNKFEVEVGNITKKRSGKQNNLQWAWCQEIAEQKGDETATEIQGFNKLLFGVPILREENEKFREFYDKYIKPLLYEDKLKIMQGDFVPVTRIMTTRQKKRFLDDVYDHWRKEGFVLTQPDYYGMET